MKKLAIVLLFTLILLSISTVTALGAKSETTGGGWFIDEVTGNRITLGFKAKPLGQLAGPAKGKFQLIDHIDGIRVHGDFEIIMPEFEPNITSWEGTCFVNYTQAPFYFWVTFWDEGEPGISTGDYLSMGMQRKSPPYEWIYYRGYLQGGNFQVHKSK